MTATPTDAQLVAAARNADQGAFPLVGRHPAMAGTPPGAALPAWSRHRHRDGITDLPEKDACN